MKTYCCNKCKKMIDEDDIEAIEVTMPLSRALFPQKKEEFAPVRENIHDEDQHLHYCGECKGDFYNLI